jgi:hypothetical protein
MGLYLFQVSKAQFRPIDDGTERAFISTNHECDYDQAVSTTTLVAPGSPYLTKQNFNNVADYFLCTSLCQ